MGRSGHGFRSSTLPCPPDQRCQRVEGSPERSSADLVLLDLKLSKLDEGKSEGLDLLPLLKKNWPETEVIVLTGHPTLDAAVEATKRGAFHFQKKPHDDGLYNLVKRALELKEANNKVREELIETRGVFQSAPMKAVVRTIERIAPSDVPSSSRGEWRRQRSGRGSHSCVSPRRAIHQSQLRRPAAGVDRERIVRFCQRRFYGAQADREGLFRQAEGGTLLLDELAEMPVDTQSKLLRVLQEKEWPGGRPDQL